MIPYLLAAIGGYLIGESQKKDSGEVSQMAKGGRTSSDVKAAILAQEYDKKTNKPIGESRIELIYNDNELFKDYKTKKEIKETYEDFWSYGNKDKYVKVKAVEFMAEFSGCAALFEFDAKERLEELREELRAETISYGELAELQSLSKYIDKNDVELLEAAGVEEYAKGGKVKSKKWIQEALTGDEGSLRRTAKRKGLLRGDENLSMTDLKKLQKMGGKTGKRAHLAETLRKFDDGGMMANDDLRKAIYDMDEDEYVNFCAEYELDSDDSNEVENFVYEAKMSEAKKMIEDIKAGKYK